MVYTYIIPSRIAGDLDIFHSHGPAPTVVERSALAALHGGSWCVSSNFSKTGQGYGKSERQLSRARVVSTRT